MCQPVVRHILHYNSDRDDGQTTAYSAPMTAYDRASGETMKSEGGSGVLYRGWQSSNYASKLSRSGYILVYS